MQLLFSGEDSKDLLVIFCFVGVFLAVVLRFLSLLRVSSMGCVLYGSLYALSFSNGIRSSLSKKKDKLGFSG